jgi:aquaporin Z
MLRLSQKTLAEFLGTFAIIFLGCGSLMILERFPHVLGPTIVPIIFGVTVACMIYTMGHISGAHFNPAVTLAFTLTRHFPKSEILSYWLAQFLGGFFALLLLFVIFPHGISFGATIPSIDIFNAFILEIVLTFFLMLVIVSVATDTRAEGTMAGVAIGGIVTVCSYVGGPLSGGSMNPARSLAPLIFEGKIHLFWIYFLGPITGAILAAFVYRFICCEANQNHSQGCC